MATASPAAGEGRGRECIWHRRSGGALSVATPRGVGSMSHHFGCARHRSRLPRRVPGPERRPPLLALPAHRRVLPHPRAGALRTPAALRGERECAPGGAPSGRLQPHQQLGWADPRLLLLGHPLRDGQAGGVPAVAIWGPERALVRSGGLLPRRGHLRVRYGRPVTVSGRSGQEIADAIAAEVAALLPPRYAGIHGRASAPTNGRPPARRP